MLILHTIYRDSLLDFLFEETHHDVHDVFHEGRQAQEVHALWVGGVGLLIDSHGLLAQRRVETFSMS